MQTVKCVVGTYISHTWYTYLSTRVLLYTMFQNTCIHCFVWEETQCMSVSQSLWVPSSSVVSVLAYVTTTTTVPTLAWLSPLKRTKFASSRKNVSRVYRKTSRGWLAPLLCWWSSSWSSLRPSLVMSRGTSACWSLMLLLHTWSTSPVGTVDCTVKKSAKIKAHMAWHNDWF